MKNSDSHLYLYAKNHYEKTDTIEDLKKIVAERCGLYPEHVSVADIYSILSGIAFKHIMNSGNPEYFFKEFLDNVSPINKWLLTSEPEDKNYDFTISVIESSLSVLRFVKVYEGDKTLIELDKPDANILPLKKKE